MAKKKKLPDHASLMREQEARDLRIRLRVSARLEAADVRWEDGEFVLHVGGIKHELGKDAVEAGTVIARAIQSMRRRAKQRLLSGLPRATSWELEAALHESLTELEEDTLMGGVRGGR